MASTTPDDLTQSAHGIVQVWSANPDFKLKDVTLAQFQADVATFSDTLASIATKELELKPMRNQRDDLAAKLDDICVRARAGIKGYFGGNSSEYELVGGTRDSERKKGSGRKKNTAAANS